MRNNQNSKKQIEGFSMNKLVSFRERRFPVGSKRAQTQKDQQASQSAKSRISIVRQAVLRRLPESNGRSKRHWKEQAQMVLLLLP